MQSIHHRRNLPKTYETKRNRIGDEKREIRKKKLSGELNLHGDLHLSRARQQSQLSLADEDAVSRQRDGSLSPKKTMKSEKKRERKRSEKTTSLPRAGKPDPSRRRARSLPPASPLSLAAARCLSPSLLTEKTMKEKRKKKRERESESAETARRKR